VTQVQNRLVDSAMRPMHRQTVRIEAVTFGSPFVAVQREIRTVHTVSTDKSGLWTADLPPTSTLGHPDAYYSVDQTDGIGRSVWSIRVPDTGGPYWLSQCLVEVPPVAPIEPGLPRGVGLVYVIDPVTGIAHLQTAESADRWGDEIRFTAAEPPVQDAPDGAVWVDPTTGVIRRAS
jgi:hypothetical protein